MADKNGSILQDDEGNVFFIPAEDLDGYRVQGDAAEKLNGEFSKLDSEVSGFDFKPKANLRPGIKPLRAFGMPANIKMARDMDDNSDTIIQT